MDVNENTLAVHVRILFIPVQPANKGRKQLEFFPGSLSQRTASKGCGSQSQKIRHVLEENRVLAAESLQLSRTN